MENLLGKNLSCYRHFESKELRMDIMKNKRKDLNPAKELHLMNNMFRLIILKEIEKLAKICSPLEKTANL